MKIILNKKVEVKNVFLASKIREIIGLMFSRRQKARNLLFSFENPIKLKIHSFFVFFSFLAIWLDDKNKIIALRKVRPFKFAVGIKEPFYKLLELPINKKNSILIKKIYIEFPTEFQKI